MNINEHVEFQHQPEGRDGEQLLNKLCADLGVNLPFAEQCLAWMDENVTVRQRMEWLDPVRELEAKHRLAWHLLVQYQNHQKTAADMQMSTRAMALELGYTTAAGAQSAADLARSCGVKKQTVNKCTLSFQSKLKLPPRPGQRPEEAREKMSEQRKAQLANRENDKVSGQSEREKASDSR